MFERISLTLGVFSNKINHLFTFLFEHLLVTDTRIPLSAIGTFTNLPIDKMIEFKASIDKKRREKYCVCKCGNHHPKV